MTVSGPCESCGAPLQGGHAHCVICGLVVIPAESAAIEAPVAPAPRFAIPLPPQMAVLAAVLALGFGGVIGSALSPGIETILAAAAAAPPPAPVEEPMASIDAPGGGGGSGGLGGSAGSSFSPTTAPATATVTPAPIATAPASDPIVEEPIEEEVPADANASTDEEEEGVADDGTTIAAGTVIRVNPEAESYSLASGAAVSTIHSDDLPEAGISVSVPTVPLFNATLSEEGDRDESGAEKTATFSGTVTFVDEEQLLYVLSSAGASIPVRLATGSGKADLPKLSSLITVDATIDPAAEAGSGGTEPEEPGSTEAGADPTIDEPSVDPTTCESQEPFPREPVNPEIELTQESFTVDFEELTTASLEGIVQATCPELDQIVVSADDLRETGKDLVLTTPKEVDPTGFEPGESITINANPTPGEDGTLEVSGIAGDDGLKGADDVESGQGDKALRAPARLGLRLGRLFR